MFQYQYVEFHTGGGSFMNNADAQHREIIAQYARDGWRYVGFMPLSFSSYGGLKQVDLIFEKEVTP